ncbi:MAG: DUF3800 domain-containing protein [Bacteroidales bacterium]|nr:DUF3800 domain-containing protein [Bacteroidales bacterium]
MNNNYDIYIDESCHLENDRFPAMVMGYIKVKKTEYEQIRNDIKKIKLKHHSPFELKWTKVSASRIDYYKELIDYFWGSGGLSYRCVLVKYKENFNHKKFNNGSHDLFYYKMIYYLLRPNTSGRYRVFIDIKDTRGREKLRKIQEVLENYHHSLSPFERFQHIRSEDNDFIQLADFFIGAVSYKARNEHLKDNANSVKKEIIEYIESKTNHPIDKGTQTWITKFNIFDHKPTDNDE